MSEPRKRIRKKPAVGSPKSEAGSPQVGKSVSPEDESQNPEEKHSAINTPHSALKEPEPGNTNHDTEQMEVHHHPQLEHKPKPWKEYLLEYFMIFLAVMTGFFAESYREHLSDRSKEKEYLSALKVELRNDMAHYDTCLFQISKLRPDLDSFFVNVSYPARYNYVLKGKWNTPVNEYDISYMPALSIIQQLKSSGSLRLINNKEIALKIIQYETFIEGAYKLHFEAIDRASNKVYQLEDELCDETEFMNKVDDNMKRHVNNDAVGNTGVYDMPIKIRDAAKLNQLANSAVNYNGRCWGYTTLLNKAKKQAGDLLTLITKNYSLEDE